MELLEAGANRAFIAFWPGHESGKTASIDVKGTRYRPTNELLAA